MNIEVEIFNNSQGTAENVSCEFFLGKPVEKNNKLMLPGNHLGKADVGKISALERRRVTLAGQKLQKPIYVTVQLFLGVIPLGIYWGVYPPEAFFS